MGMEFKKKGKQTFLEKALQRPAAISKLGYVKKKYLVGRRREESVPIGRQVSQQENAVHSRNFNILKEQKL